MSTTTLIEKSEKIKNSFKETAEKSKETLREIIESNNKNIWTALDSNKKIVDAVKERLNQKETPDTVTDTLKTTFGKSVELSEEALDSIINSYTTQVQFNIDFNTKLVDAVKETTTGENSEKVLRLIQENFETSRQLTVRNTKEIIDFYNKHTNLAVNFNKKFGETITSQIELLTAVQNTGLTKFTEWAFDWWKENEKEVKY